MPSWHPPSDLKIHSKEILRLRVPAVQPISCPPAHVPFYHVKGWTIYLDCPTGKLFSQLLHLRFVFVFVTHCIKYLDCSLYCTLQYNLGLIMMTYRPRLKVADDCFTSSHGSVICTLRYSLLPPTQPAIMMSDSNCATSDSVPCISSHYTFGLYSAIATGVHTCVSREGRTGRGSDSQGYWRSMIY